MSGRGVSDTLAKTSRIHRQAVPVVWVLVWYTLRGRGEEGGGKGREGKEGFEKDQQHMVEKMRWTHRLITMSRLWLFAYSVMV